MRNIFLYFFLLLTNESFSQCLTSYDKIHSTLTTNPYYQNFAGSIDINGNIAAVGIGDSDSLQYHGGLVYVYHKQDGDWQRIAILRPETMHPNMKFGSHVRVTENYIFVAAVKTSNYVPRYHGAIFVFRKPATGWKDATEIAKLSVEHVDPSLHNGIQINKEENAIAVHSTYTYCIFSKKGPEWIDDNSPRKGRTVNQYESIKSISIDDDVLAYLTHDLTGANIYLYQAADSAWSYLKPLATISEDRDIHQLGYDMKLYKDQLVIGSNKNGRDTTFVYTTLDKWNTIESPKILTVSDSVINYHSGEFYVSDSVIAFKRITDFSQDHLYYFKKLASGWQNASEDFSIDIPSSRSFTENVFALNGHDLVISGLFDGYEDYSDRHLLFTSIENQMLEIKNHFSRIRKGASNRQFGKTVKHYKDLLAVAMDDNDINKFYSARVEIYKRDDNGQYKFLQRISPNPAYGNLDRFGEVIEFYDNYLFISAPTGSNNGEGIKSGLVVVYEASEDWNQLKEVALLRPTDRTDEEGNLYPALNFGSSIHISDTAAIIGAGSNYQYTEIEDGGEIYVFEKEAEVPWQSSYQTARLTTAFGKDANLGETMAVHEGRIFANHHISGYSGYGHISVFEKPPGGWKDTVETQFFTFSVSKTGYQGFNDGEIVIANDRLFVGQPGYKQQYSNSAGRILVFELPGKDDTHLNQVSEIRLENPSEYHFLGSEFEVIGNTLVSGSGYISNGYYLGDERKGEVNILQSSDKNWHEYSELIRLQGDMTTSVDAFGYSISADKDQIIIGAHLDDSNVGFRSGAVYAIAMPPIIMQLDTICIDEGMVKLEAYPFDGTWEGDGISSEKNSYFDPRQAGVGTHKISYKTPSCQYIGEATITVVPREKISFNHAATMEICEEDTALLEVIIESDSEFTWFFLPEGKDSAIVIANNLNKTTAYSPGRYWVETSNMLCPNFSDTILVYQTINEISFDSIPLICDPEEKVQLNVQPSDGYWLSDAINSDHLLSASSLEAGENAFIYFHESSAKCIYSDTIIVLFDPLEIDEIPVSSQEICATTEVTIPIQPYENTNYYLHQIRENDTTKTPISSNYLKLTDEGTYRISIEKHYCTLSSEDFEINYLIDSVFFPNVITHNKDLVNDFFEPHIENAKFKQIRIYNRYGDLVFSSNAYKNNWPDKKYPTGTYFFDFYYSTICNPEIKDAKGWIQLME